MNHTNSNISLEVLLAALKDKERKQWAINELKNLNSSDKELLGLQYFMEQNNYDVTKLALFLSSTEQRFADIKHTPSKPSYGWLKMVASVVVLVSLSVGGYFYMFSENSYEKYAFHEPGLPVFMSDDNTSIDNWMTEFKDNNFITAQKMGEELLAKNANNDTILYFLGVIYCQLENYPQGLINFKKVSFNNVELKNKAYFLEALCVLETNKTDAKKYFEAIAKDTSSVYAEKATQILIDEY